MKKDLFEDFTYTPENVEEPTTDTVFSFQLNILLECLNIFGTASGSASGFTSGTRQAWRRTDEESDNEDIVNGQRNGTRGRPQNNANGRIDSFFPRADGKGTGMRLSYAGEGYPLVILL